MRRGWCRGLEGDSQGSHSCSKLAALIRPHQRDAFPLRLTFATAFALLATVAVAQIAPRAPKPYAAVAIARPAPSADPGFVAFRSAVAAAAKSRVYADLAALVQAQGFFWDRDFDRGHDPRRPAADNLAAAVALERRNGAGWDTARDAGHRARGRAARSPGRA